MVAPLADCYKWSDMGPYNWPKMHLGIFHPYKWISAFYPSMISFFGAKRRPFLRDDNFSGPKQRRSKSIPQWHSVFLDIHLQNLSSKRIPRPRNHTLDHTIRWSQTFWGPQKNTFFQSTLLTKMFGTFIFGNPIFEVPKLFPGKVDRKLGEQNLHTHQFA